LLKSIVVLYIVQVEGSLFDSNVYILLVKITSHRVVQAIFVCTLWSWKLQELES